MKKSKSQGALQLLLLLLLLLLITGGVEGAVRCCRRQFRAR